MKATDFYEMVLPTGEFAARLEAVTAAVAGPDGDAIREEIAWFLQHYPNPLDRVAYSRRKHREAMRFCGVAR